MPTIKLETFIQSEIEICYDCHKYQSSGEMFTLGKECSQKIKMLKELFIQTGITYVSSIKPFK